MRVTVIDYKAGNLTSVLKALRHLGAEVEVTDGDPAPVESAERLVLPGVGHFAATQRLTRPVYAGYSCSYCTWRSFPRHLRWDAMALRRLKRSAFATWPRTFSRVVYALF